MVLHKGVCVLCGKTRKVDENDVCFWCWDKAKIGKLLQRS